MDGLLVMVTTLRFTVPAFAADTSATADWCRDAMPAPITISSVRLYGAPRNWDGASIPLLRSHAVTAGQADTFQVVDDAPGWSYFVAAVSAWGSEGCWAGISVGIPATGVADVRPREAAWLDLMGRRLPGKPLRAGVYLHGGRVVRVF